MTSNHYLYVTLAVNRCRSLLRRVPFHSRWLLLLMAITPAFSQTVPDGSAYQPNVVQSRTPQSGVDASNVLEHAIAASGGRQAWKALADFQADGSLSLYSQGAVMESGNAMVQGADLKRFRLTATLEDETRTWLWKDGSGTLSSRLGVTSIGRQNLAVLEGITLPALKIIRLLDGPSRSIEIISAGPNNENDVYRVRITRTAKDAKEAIALGRSSYATEVLVDRQSFAIVAIEDTIHPNDHNRDAFQHKVMYADYRSVGEIQVPFSVKEEIDGHLTWGLQLNSFQANVGLGSSAFVLN